MGPWQHRAGMFRQSNSFLNLESPDHHAKRLVRQLERLGYDVDLHPLGETA